MSSSLLDESRCALTFSVFSLSQAVAIFLLIFRILLDGEWNLLISLNGWYCTKNAIAAHTRVVALVYTLYTRHVGDVAMKLTAALYPALTPTYALGDFHGGGELPTESC